MYMAHKAEHKKLMEAQREARAAATKLRRQQRSKERRKNNTKSHRKYCDICKRDYDDLSRHRVSFWSFLKNYVLIMFLSASHPREKT
jgi:hypothetical protein